MIPCPACGSEECTCAYEGPYVCPGCYAVGGKPCAPGCIDAEMAREVEEAMERGDYDRFDDDDE